MISGFLLPYFWCCDISTGGKLSKLWLPENSSFNTCSDNWKIVVLTVLKLAVLEPLENNTNVSRIHNKEMNKYQ